MAGGPGEPRTAEHPGLGLREAGADASEGLACGAAAETETVQSIRQRLGAAAAGGAGSYASRMRDMTASSRSPKTARTAGVSSAAWGGAATTAEKVAAAALQRAEEERELRALGIEEDEEESASEDEDRHVVGAVAHQSSGASRPISSPRAEHIASGGALDDEEEDTVPVLAAAPVRRWRETAGRGGEAAGARSPDWTLVARASSRSASPEASPASEASSPHTSSSPHSPGFARLHGRQGTACSACKLALPSLLAGAVSRFIAGDSSSTGLPSSSLAAALMLNIEVAQ